MLMMVLWVQLWRGRVATCIIDGGCDQGPARSKGLAHVELGWAGVSFQSTTCTMHSPSYFYPSLPAVRAVVVLWWCLVVLSPRNVAGLAAADWQALAQGGASLIKPGLLFSSMLRRLTQISQRLI